MRKIDETGNRYGMLVVIKEVESYSSAASWLCLCDCGNTSVVLGVSLRRGKNLGTKSCGCLFTTKTHGYTSNTEKWPPEYTTWRGMKKRCNNPNDKSYPNYGGRGIKVCEEWQKDFQSFYDYIGRRPGPEYSIDRIDNNGNYEPGNVRWADRHTQNINRRPAKPHYITPWGKGVRETSSGKYSVRLRGKHLGTFDTEQEALQVRQEAIANENIQGRSSRRPPRE